MDSITHAASGALLGMAVGQWVLPEAIVSCIAIGTIAGSLPDLDFLAELRGKVAAWKYHRILTHNIPVAFLLTLLLACLASYSLSLPFTVALILCVGATALHLLLDVLTSFGTCLWYPFTTKRYSTRSHFIVDPFVLGLCLYGLFSTYAWQYLFALMLYISFSLIVKSMMQVFIGSRLPVGLNRKNLRLEPIFLAPFRWLVIVNTGEGYVYCYRNLMWQSPWYSRNHECEEFEDLCLQHDLMRYVLKTFDMPLFKFRTYENGYFLVVEDLKWRSEPGLRPLAFTLKLQQEKQQWKIVEATQGGFFQRSDSAFFEPPEKWIR
ncbi:MAG: metal-dependent hydrolase [Granulosicoccus sp.]